jgi:hypothetical protein
MTSNNRSARRLNNSSAYPDPLSVSRRSQRHILISTGELLISTGELLANAGGPNEGSAQ